MLRLIKITGESMTPDYRSGEFVLTARFPAVLRRLRPGDVVVLRHPVYGLLIKRIARIESDTGSIHVIGNHPHSVDSRNFGPLSAEMVIGKVIWHIARPR